MDEALKIIALIVIPLLWGLGVEYLFESWRRRRPQGEEEQEGGPYDWVI